jgi:hypothetical protein
VVCVVVFSIVVLTRSPTTRARGAQFFKSSDKFHLGAAIHAAQNVFPIRARVVDLLYHNWPQAPMAENWLHGAGDMPEALEPFFDVVLSHL